VTLLLLVLYLAGVIGFGSPPVSDVLAVLGSVTIVAGTGQALIGLWHDRHHDPRIRAQWPWAPCYPVYYWVLCACSAVRGTLPGLLTRSPKVSTWNTARTVPQPRTAADSAAESLHQGRHHRIEG
jgi:hypothetical protein